MFLISNTPDNAVEQFYLKEDLLHTRIGIITAICFCLAFIRNDYIFFGISSQFYQAVSIRAIFVSISLGALYILRKISKFQEHERLVYIWCTLLILMCTYFNATRQADNINFTYLDPVVVLLIAIYFPGSIWVKSFSAGWLSISDLLIITLLKMPKYTSSLEVIIFSYVISLFLGMVIAAKIDKFRYDQYYALLKEHSMRLELEKVAYTDYLTGTLNRRKFFELAIHQFNQFELNDVHFSIIMLDLDYFKNLNDKFGHAAGDVFLQSFTTLILNHIRPTDILGRLGGEEFAIILPETTLDYTKEIAERIRSFCETNEETFNKKTLKGTVSIGATEVSIKDHSFHDTLKRADNALYQAKRNGRNRVHLIAVNA
jgi:diguanylate cyclase (GGDEF)-like protein